MLTAFCLYMGFFLLSPAIGQAQTLVDLQGIVELSSDSGETWVPAFDGDMLEKDMLLRTLNNSTVRVALEKPDTFIRVAANSQLERQVAGYKLIIGHIYANASNLQIFTTVPKVRIDGIVRVDVTEEYSRLATFSGTVVAALSVNGNARLIKPGMQLLCNHLHLSDDTSQSHDTTTTSEDKAIISPYIEQDPWYLNQVVVEGEGATVNALQGTAELLTTTANDEPWKPASIDAVFDVGMQARTGADSWLELTFANGSILRLQEDTHITFVTYQDLDDGSRQTVIDLARGILWNVVEGEQQRFEVHTLGMVAGVRGTKFRIDASEGVNNQDAGNDAHNNAKIKVFEGNVMGVVDNVGVPVDANEQFTPDDGLEPLELDAIDMFNQARDALINDASRPQVRLSPNVKNVVLIDTTTLTLQGQVQHVDTLIIDDILVDVDDDGTFSIVLEPPLGEHIVVIKAQNEAYTDESYITVVRESLP